MATRFEGLFVDRVALERDRTVAPALATETRPVAEALIEGCRGLARIEREAGELREAVALASLLGRRAAVLGATPTGALEIVPALLEAVSSEEPRAVELLDALRSVCIEGYVAAREEAIDERAARRAADAIPMIEVAPECFAVLPAGAQDADELERVLDELGRRLLDRGARVCIVDASKLLGPDPERARRLFAIQETCRMLGVACVFTALDAAWRQAARDAGMELGDARFEPDFEAALRAGLEACGLELRQRRGLAEALRRFALRAPR